MLIPAPSFHKFAHENSPVSELLRIAIGLIMTSEGFIDKTPEEVYRFLCAARQNE